MSEEEAAQQLRREVNPPKGTAAVAVATGRNAAVAGDAAAAKGLFEAGSITKTMTATLLGILATNGVVTLHTTVGDILGTDAGAASDVSLRELATHTSGLPRIATNAITLPWWPRDPYRFYSRTKLYKGLADVELGDRGLIRYSNLGFDLLGHCLEVAAKRPFKDLLTDLVLRPASMATARCQPCERTGLLRGHGSLIIGGRRWHQPVPGSGGVDCTIADLGAWLTANAFPDSTSLEAAVLLCQEIHATEDAKAIGLGWHFAGPAVWHNGGTGAFQGMVAFVPERGGACGLASFGPGPKYSLDAPVVKWAQALAG